MPARGNEYSNDDRGVFGKNDRESRAENPPSHTGKVTLSETTLETLNQMLADGKEPVLYLSGWPTRKAGVLSLKIQPPMEYQPDAQPKRGGGDRSRGSYSRDDDRGPPARGGPPPRGGRGPRSRNVDDDLAPF